MYASDISKYPRRAVFRLLWYGRHERIYINIVSELIFNEHSSNTASCTSVSVEFQYKTKSMKSPVASKAIVEWTDDNEIHFSMYKEKGIKIEYFNDCGAAYNSKWYLLYEQLLEHLENA